MGSKNHSQTELYNINTLKWKKAQPFNTSYVWFYDYATFFYDNDFYVIGGKVKIFDEDGRRSSVLKYDPNSEIWSNIGTLNFARRGHQATVIKSTFYVVGGFTKGIKSEVCNLSGGFTCTSIDRKFSDADIPLLYAYNPQQFKSGAIFLLNLFSN